MCCSTAKPKSVKSLKFKKIIRKKLSDILRHSQCLIHLKRSFSASQFLIFDPSIQKIKIDWIRTADLWCHNHCLTSFIYVRLCTPEHFPLIYQAEIKLRSSELKASMLTTSPSTQPFLLNSHSCLYFFMYQSFTTEHELMA